MFNGKIHYKWSFSIAMLNYQRVSSNVGETMGKHQRLKLPDGLRLATPVLVRAPVLSQWAMAR